MPARLLFLNGANAGITFELGDQPVTIGRSPSSTVAFPDELMVSATHASIQRRQGNYVLKDEGSRNGTLLNAHAIAEHTLHHGDLVQFGPGGPSVRFVVESSSGVAVTQELPIPSVEDHATEKRTTAAMPAIVASVPGTPEPPPQMEKRRTFLKFLSFAAGAGAALLAGIPALASFSSPVFRTRRQGTWIKLGDTSSFDAGTPNKKDFPQTSKDAWVEVQTMQSVWVFTEDGDNFIVYNASCTHLGCGYTYSESTKTFNCPCHGGRFDPRNGAVLGGPPPRPLDRLPSKVENGVLYVQLG